MTEQRFELKEREKAITVAEHLAHSLHCYSPKYDDADGDDFDDYDDVGDHNKDNHYYHSIVL